MCARMKFRARLVSPGQEINVQSEEQPGKGKWIGFARSETLEETWQDWVPLDIPADDFAEHNRPESRKLGSRVLTWAKVELGKVISGIGNRKTGEIRMVTREATEEEFDLFGHSRLPVIIDRRF